MKWWKCCEIAAAVTLEIPQVVALISPAWDDRQIAVVVDDSPGCVVCLNRSWWS